MIFNYDSASFQSFPTAISVALLVFAAAACAAGDLAAIASSAPANGGEVKFRAEARASIMILCAPTVPVCMVYRL